ncbi:MAG: UMP kinase [Eubacteriales bacterium]|nr:UMP kinase [Eubacteriales bacterium]
MSKKRFLLKLSGEALAGDRKFGFSEETVQTVAKQVKQLTDLDVEVAIVIGGGNFWRGRTGESMDRVKADQIGMLATVMNCIYASDVFRRIGLATAIYTPFAVGAFTRLFSKDAAMADLNAGKVVFFAGGTGHPYFSTDTITTLRAIEIEADEILLAKAVDGVYDSDPKTNPNARRYDTITLEAVIANRLQVMDLTATILACENRMPLRVFALRGDNAIINALSDDFEGTLVTVE